MVIETEPLLVLLSLVDGLPLPAEPGRRGHPAVNSERLILKGLVVMLVRRVWTAHGLLAIMAEPTVQMACVRAQLTDQTGHRPSRRTWERRLARLVGILPLLIARLGAYLLRRLDPWPHGGPSPSTPPCWAPAAASGTRSTARLALCRIPALTRRPAGPNRAGTGGSMDGSSIWWSPSRTPSGCLWPPISPRPTSPTISTPRGCWLVCRRRSLPSWATSTTTTLSWPPWSKDKTGRWSPPNAAPTPIPTMGSRCVAFSINSAPVIATLIKALRRFWCSRSRH